jgi:TfoX/Sxy family transcriptional regulator of competence genes
MAYSEQLAQQIRSRLVTSAPVEEKKMFGGLTFMVDGKMCLGVIGDEMMVRLDPALHEAALARPGCRDMDMMARPMPGYVLVSAEGLKSEKDWEYWLGLALAYNKAARPAKKRS